MCAGKIKVGVCMDLLEHLVSPWIFFAIYLLTYLCLVLKYVRNNLFNFFNTLVYV